MGNKQAKLTPERSFEADAGCSHPEQVALGSQMQRTLSMLKGIQPAVTAGAMIARVGFGMEWYSKKCTEEERVFSVGILDSMIESTGKMYDNLVEECRRLETLREETGILLDIREIHSPPL